MIARILGSRPVVGFIGLLLAVITAAGCAGDNQGDEIVRTGEVKADARPDGSLSADPAPLTLKDVDATPDGSAREAVMVLWFWGQWGGLPNMVLMQDDRVTGAVGASKIMDAYGLVRPDMLASRPRIVGTRTSPGGTFVAVEIRRKNQKPTQESYILKRRGSRWAVVRDTVLERGLAASAQRRLDPDITDDRPLTGGQLRAGEAAARTYRAISLSAARP